MARVGVTPEETAMLGDKLLTDMLGAHAAGVLPLMVEPLGGPQGAWNRMLHLLAAALGRRRHGKMRRSVTFFPGNTCQTACYHVEYMRPIFG